MSRISWEVSELHFIDGIHASMPGDFLGKCCPDFSADFEIFAKLYLAN